MKEFFDRLFNDPATVRKFLVAFVSALGILISEGLLPENISHWVTIVIAFLNALGIYRVPNAKDGIPPGDKPVVSP